MDTLLNEELLKNKLINYRELCPLLLDVFVWKTNIYPYIISSVITTIFGLLWYLEPSIISTFAIICLMLILCDFFLPLLITKMNILDGNEWNDENEKKYVIFINRIVYYNIIIWNFYITIDEWKINKPNMYAVCITLTLLIIAWIGNAVNNLLLLYVLVLFISLLPGLLHRRIIQKYTSELILLVGGFIGIKPKTK